MAEAEAEAEELSLDVELYIPVGSFCWTPEDLDAPAGFRWPSTVPHQWRFGLHPRDQGHRPEQHLDSPLQKLLLEARPLLYLRELFYSRWACFSFCVRDAGRYAACRVYLLPDDVSRRLLPRSNAKLRRHLQSLLAQLDYSTEAWRGECCAGHVPLTLAEAVKGRKGEAADEDLTLLEMFNRIPPPQPQAALVGNEMYQDIMDSLATSKIRGLKSTLYAYQSQSAAVMLQRELSPGRVLDPRLLPIADQAGRTWFYDDVTGEVLRQARYYDGVSGGILAEEMGTGKTLICLSLILATRAFPAEMPEVCRGNTDGTGGPGVRRPRIGSLADMAAAVVTRQSVPWKLFFEGEAGAETGAEYRTCIDAIKRNPAQYRVLDQLDTWREPCRTPRHAPQKPVERAPVTLSSCSLVIVPANLVRQWEQEIDKHTAGLRVLVVAGKRPVPTAAEILEADILLFSIARFERLERDRQVTRHGVVFLSPLASVHFKRVIVDEGHRLGNSRMGAKSNLLLALELIQVSARWIVTGTPSTGLFGVDEAVETVESEHLDASSHLQERRDLERIGAMASMYLKVRPWANQALETGDTPADWAVYVMQPKHSNRSSGRKDCLRATLASLIIRHRKAEVGDLLPPVAERVVLLDGSFQDRLCLNLFAMMILFNAVQSQRTDQDYFFHPSQRSALLQLVSNMRQSTFFGGYFYSTAEIAKAVATAEQFLVERRVPISADDERALREGIAFGRMAQENVFKRMVDRIPEIPVFVQDFPGGGECARAWSIDEQMETTTDSRLTCTAAPLLHALQKFVRPCMDAPHSLQVLFDSGRFAEKGREVRQRQAGQTGEAGQAGQAGQTGQPGQPGQTANTRLESIPLKRRAGSLGTPAQINSMPGPEDEADLEIAEPLEAARIVSTASAKLSYLLAAIVRHQVDEQIIVFYDNENVAFFLAEHLEILQIHHLIYARGITAERRAQYVDTFNHNARFRVLLMDLSQAAFGLDMRSASRVYFLSPVLNPQVEAQAIGRVRRISQQRQVSVETLVLRDSLEELMVERRQALTQAEHRTMKTILDDRPLYEWILHARVLPLPLPLPPTRDQMAPLAVPQFLFGRGFGRVQHPDEGLVNLASTKRGLAGNLDSLGSLVSRRPKKARLAKVQVRFADPETPL